MAPTVLVTGPMRSGTSLVAAIVHRLGFQISAYIPAPAPPSWRSDWEDPELTEKLIREQPVDWSAYLKRRREMSIATGFEGRVAVKSPYLALHYGAISERSVGPFWIRCDRPQRDVARSFSANPSLSLKHQARIERALVAFQPNFIVNYDDAVRDPSLTVARIAAALGVTDAAAELAAAALVGQPTEYETCPR